MYRAIGSMTKKKKSKTFFNLFCKSKYIFTEKKKLIIFTFFNNQHFFIFLCNKSGLSGLVSKNQHLSGFSGLVKDLLNFHIILISYLGKYSYQEGHEHLNMKSLNSRDIR